MKNSHKANLEYLSRGHRADLGDDYLTIWFNDDRTLPKQIQKDLQKMGYEIASVKRGWNHPTKESWKVNITSDEDSPNPFNDAEKYLDKLAKKNPKAGIEYEGDDHRRGYR